MKMKKWKGLDGNRNAAKENPAKNTITLRVTDPQKAFIVHAAKVDNISRSDWMKARLFKK